MTASSDIDPTNPGQVLQKAQEILAAGNLAEAEPLFKEVINAGVDRQSSLICYSALSTIAENLGDINKSIRMSLRLLALTRETHGEDSDQTVAEMVRLARLYENVGRFDEANDLYYRAKLVSEKVVEGEVPDPVLDVPSADDQYQAPESTMKRKEAKPKDEQRQGGVSLDEDDGPDFQFAEAAEEPEKAPKRMHRVEEETGPLDIAKVMSRFDRAELDALRNHKFRPEKEKEEDYVWVDRRVNPDPAETGRTTSTRNPVSEKELRKQTETSSAIEALARGSEEIARTFDLKHLLWSGTNFFKNKNNIYLALAGFFVFTFCVGFFVWTQPRKFTPLDAYVSMPHEYRSIDHATTIKLVREDSTELTQADNMMSISTTYFVNDWRGKLDLLLRSLAEKHYWLVKAGNALVSEDDANFYTANDPNNQIADQLTSVVDKANDFYITNQKYPGEKELTPYENVYTHQVMLPSLKKSEIMASSKADAITQLTAWQNKIREEHQKTAPGSIACFRVVASFPGGFTELFAARNDKSYGIAPQIVYAKDGSMLTDAVTYVVSPSQQPFRWRRLCIVQDQLPSAEAFCIRHFGIVLCSVLSVLFAASYGLFPLKGRASHIRFLLLFGSTAGLAFYAFEKYLP